MTTEVAKNIVVPTEDLNLTMRTEQEFYASYDWCLNAYPSIAEMMQHLEQELPRFSAAQPDWRRDEIARNIYLLSCAILDMADDYLLGRRYNFSKVLGVLPALAPVTNLAQKGLHTANQRYWLSRQRVWNWRRRWEAAVVAALRRLLLADPTSTDANSVISDLQHLLCVPIAVSMRGRHPRIPAAFRSQDLTHFDVLSLGEKFVREFPDRSRPLLVAGLRTAGSYFAFLLRAYLESKGFTNVECVTLRPKAGASPWEKERISRKASENCLTLIIDEPIATGGTLGKGIALLTKHGVAARNVVVLFPVHRNGRGWRSHADSAPISACHVITLEHEEWYKHRLIASARPEAVLRDYFEAEGWGVEVDVSSPEAADANDHLKAVSEDKYHSRLKQVYSVHLTRAGETTTKLVLAKSVGWGWLGYHAFVAGQRLAAFVPPVLGLREGILYSEWVSGNGISKTAREELAHTLADYVGARARTLRLNSKGRVDVMRDSQPGRGIEELAGRLSTAHGKAGGFLRRARMKRELAAMQSHVPALIDGRMRRVEWVTSDGKLLKADFEQHGMGKHQLNLTDPAYDLAEAILHWNLSAEEEQKLLDRYTAITGDRTVFDRILLHKILAGSWSLDRALENLNDHRMRGRHQEFNRQYIDTWNFLVAHTARFCASLCYRPQEIHWNSPLVVLDVDGVIDQQVFGYPSTTLAGIQAISLLHANGFGIALNTARSVPELKEYCRTYGFAGGVSEYGAHVWDGVTDHERILVSDESLQKLDCARRALRQIPGVYINDDYVYSIKAYTYEKGRSVPLPKIMVQDLLAALGLEDLSIHPTYSDTAILGNDSDKGQGLVELLRLAGLENAKTYAVGDSSPDLRMFQVATHSFAPGHIACASAARLLGCKIASHGYQKGFLECAQAIVESTGGNAQVPSLKMNALPPQPRYLLNTLRAADRSAMNSLVRAMVDRSVLQNFIAD